MDPEDKLNFPSAPNEKTGWPWVSPAPSATNGPSWPRLTIITPSFNQGQFLEETVRSVLLQGYPNLEYLVFDGGSADNSVDIIRKYEPWISFWESVPDRGQAHAINKGFERGAGDLFGWINSDDILLPGALWKLATAYIRNPNKILLGDVINFREGSPQFKTVRQKNICFETMALMQVSGAVWHQPGTFVPAACFQPEKIFLDESLRYTFDQDWMCRLLKDAGVTYLDEPVAMFRLHPASKTVGENIHWLPEVETVVRRYWDDVPGLNKKKVLAYFETVRASVSLGAKKWDRKKGIQHLRNAFLYDPGLIFSRTFIELNLRSMLPRPFLMWLRERIWK